jgi:cytochrome d ubiquinol oxidase subunit II
MLVLHGATYAALKVGEPMQSRAVAVARAAAIVFAVLFIVAGIWVAIGLDGHRIVSIVDASAPSNPLLKQVVVTDGAWLDNFRARPTLWLVPVVAVAAALATAWLLHIGRAGTAFVASSVVQAGTIFTAGVALFPFLMPSSTEPGHGLTVWDASSSAKTLGIMLAAVLVFLPIVLVYTTWVFRVLRGRITLEEIRRHGDTY